MFDPAWNRVNPHMPIAATQPHCCLSRRGDGARRKRLSGTKIAAASAKRRKAISTGGTSAIAALVTLNALPQIPMTKISERMAVARRDMHKTPGALFSDEQYMPTIAHVGGAVNFCQQCGRKVARAWRNEPPL